MKKDSQVFIQHIIESINWIEKDINGLTEEDFMDNVLVQDAVIRRLEIVGEAVKNLPEEYKQNHPQIAWSKAMGMRNILIHEYFGVDIQVVWSTITTVLPEFKKQIESLSD